MQYKSILFHPIVVPPQNLNLNIFTFSDKNSRNIKNFLQNLNCFSFYPYVFAVITREELDKINVFAKFCRKISSVIFI